MSDHLIAEANRHAMVLPTTQPTHADIAWYVREVYELRAELELLREWQREVIQNANAHHAERKEAIARAERAEAEVKKLTGFYNEIVVECGHDRIVREYRQRGELLRDEANRRKEAEAELADIRALANRRNKRDRSQDTTHQLVAALDQALDIAQAELAQFRELDAERARMRQIAVDKRIRTPTPQTDEEAGSLIDAEEVVPADFARTLEQELAAERVKAQTLRSACESIEEQWDKNHSANPFHAGNVMQSHAMRALAATEDAQ